jgi:predicted secreted protein
MHYENVSEKEPISADEGASLKIIINTQYSIEKITTLNTKTTNNNKKIVEFNFNSAKNKEFFDFKLKMSFEQETFFVKKT